MKGFFKKCETCSKDFWLTPSIFKRKGRGRFCSKICWYKTKIGSTPWNKGLTGMQVAWNKNKKMPQISEENHPMWKEKGYGYSAVHNWVRKRISYPKECSDCGEVKKVEWANISHKYKRDVNDYIALCKKCHVKYDRKGAWGLATKLFSL